MLRYRIASWSAQLALLLPALLLPSCIRLDKPLSDPDKAKPDKRLIGAWRTETEESKGTKSFFHFIGKFGHRGFPPGIMKLVSVHIDVDGKITTEGPSFFFTTSVGDNSYINWLAGADFDRSKFPIWDKGNIEPYFLIKYKIERDKLIIWTACQASAEAAIRKRQVKGIIHKGTKLWPSSVSLEGAENLARFLADGGDKVLFPDEEEHKRILSRVE